MPMELQRLPKMRQEVIRSVSSRIQMELMRYAFSRQLLVQLGCSVLKSKIVLLAAIEINRQRLQFGSVLTRQNERVVLVPMRNINRVAEHSIEQIAEWPG